MISSYFYKIKRKLIQLNPFNKTHFDIFESKIHWNVYTYLKKRYSYVLSCEKIYENEGTTSNKVWWCWLQGEENAPKLNKACLNSLKKNLSDREIVVITNQNLDKYVQIPDFIKEKHANGIIPNAQYSDIIRLELLIKYGGTWIDSSVLCTENKRIFFDKPLFVFENWKRGDSSIVASNWFITSNINNHILLLTRDLLYEYWKNENYLVHYYVFHFFFAMATEKFYAEWEEIPRYSNLPPHILQFEITEKYSTERFEEIKKMSAFHKLNQKADFSKCEKESFYEFILNEYLEGGK